MLARSKHNAISFDHAIVIKFHNRSSISCFGLFNIHFHAAIARGCGNLRGFRGVGRNGISRIINIIVGDAVGIS